MYVLFLDLQCRHRISTFKHSLHTVKYGTRMSYVLPTLLNYYGLCFLVSILYYVINTVTRQAHCGRDSWSQQQSFSSWGWPALPSVCRLPRQQTTSTARHPPPRRRRRAGTRDSGLRQRHMVSICAQPVSCVQRTCAARGAAGARVGLPSLSQWHLTRRRRRRRPGQGRR